jgi:hypothetical protein
MQAVDRRVSRYERLEIGDRSPRLLDIARCKKKLGEAHAIVPRQGRQRDCAAQGVRGLRTLELLLGEREIAPGRRVARP